MTSVWEYKTILVPAMDDWLQHDSALAIQAATGKGHGKIISKHSTFLNEQLGILGRDGWELVSIWQSDPAALFKYTAQWMTFKRSV